MVLLYLLGLYRLHLRAGKDASFLNMALRINYYMYNT